MENFKFMCRPCAEKLKAEGKVIIHKSKRGKETCNECQRRRYVYEIEEVESND